jgi:uncharacterized protein with PIN domain
VILDASALLAMLLKEADATRLNFGDYLAYGFEGGQPLLLRSAFAVQGR